MNDKSKPQSPSSAFAAKRSFKACGVLFAKGFCMGTADVVPGVSGGTMALVLGIYEELLQSIRAIDLQFFRLLAALQFKRALQSIPLAFLTSLFAGVLMAVFTLAKALSWLLHNYPIGIWSFFFRFDSSLGPAGGAADRVLAYGCVHRLDCVCRCGLRARGYRSAEYA